MIPPAETPVLELIRQGAEVADCLPEDISNADLNAAIHGLVGQVVEVEVSRVVRRYMLGKAMSMAMRRQDFLPEMGFDKFADYQAHLQATVQKSHGHLWTWKPIVEKLPPLSRQQLETIPGTSLYWICQHVQERAHDEMLAVAAKAQNLREVVRYAEDRGYVSAPDSGTAQLVVSGDREQIGELRKFLDHEKVREYAGERYIDVLLALKNESQGGEGFSDWPKI